MYMQRLPGGLCFAHGPYRDGYECSHWPACATAPKQQHWIDLAFRRRKKRALIDAAATLEKDDLLPEIVVLLRQKAEEYVS